MSIRGKLAVVSLVTLGVCCPSLLTARDCEPPVDEPWDWEEVPESRIAGPGDDRCGGEAPVSDPSVESFYGDYLPVDLISTLYGLELDATDLLLPPGEELAVFQLRDSLTDPIVTVLLQGGPSAPTYKVVWVDESDGLHSITFAGSSNTGEVLTVSWIRGTSSTDGSIEVTLAGQTVVARDVDNDGLQLSEARLGIVDANRHPEASAGTLRFYPRAKYWDF